jgi:F0F1-type ATP synthase assembly protein I
MAISNDTEMVEILLNNQEDDQENNNNIEQNYTSVACSICLDKQSDKIINKKYHRIHTCKDSIICDSCLLEFNKRMVKLCPICKLPLLVSSKEKLSMSNKGLLITSIILVIIIKNSIESVLTPIILHSNSDKSNENQSYMAMLIVSNSLINYGGILFIGIALGYLYEKYLKSWLFVLLISLLYHIIVLAIINNISALNPKAFKNYMLYFNLPVYGTIYLVVILIMIYHMFKNCSKCCLENLFETKIKHFHIESIEIH